MSALRPTLSSSGAARAAPDARQQALLETLRPHRSSLPTTLYLLSFCPKLSYRPREFFRHPGVIYALGFFSALVAGLGILSLDILYGVVWTAQISGPDVSDSVIRSSSNRTAWIMTICACIYFVFCWVFLACFSSASHQLTQRLAHAYVASCLSQDAAFHDKHGAGEIATHAGKEVGLIRVVYGEKLGFVVWSMSTLVASVITGFIKNARVAGTLFSLIPFAIILFTVIAIYREKVAGPLLRLEGQASSFTEECLSGARILQAFGMRSHVVKRFDEAYLRPLRQLGIQRGYYRSGETAVFWFTVMLSYPLAFFAIARFFGETGPSLTAFWNYLNALFAMANVAPMVSSLVDAHSAMTFLRRTIERQPLIELRDAGGEKPVLTGPPSVDLVDVRLAYPSRPSIASLDGVSLHIPAGKVTALVGQSGSGKSTITELLMRSYDPLTSNLIREDDAADEAADRAALGLQTEEEKDAAATQKEKSGLLRSVTKLRRKTTESSEKSDEADVESTAAIKAKGKAHIQGQGKVLFHGHDLRDLNLSWLRSQIAIVRQMPQVMSATIFENVAAGLCGTPYEYRTPKSGQTLSPEEQTRYNAIRDKVVEALEKAQAWAFVCKLPNGVDTHVSGGKTGLLSGGQRQRIAIARALIRQPALLILDEGTSALDSQSEAGIREMLKEEQAKRGMTTILIAHRLSTIAHADQIVVMRAGQIVDRATTGVQEGSAHDQLMQAKRQDETYRTMVLTQRAALSQDSTSDEPQSDDASDASSCDEVLNSDMATTRVAPSLQPFRSPSHSSGLSMHSLAPRRSRVTDIPMPMAGGRGGVHSHLGHAEEAAAPAAEQNVDSDAGTPKKYLSNFFKLAGRYKSLWLIGIVGGIATGVAFPVAGWRTGPAVDGLTIPRETMNALRVSVTNRNALWFFLIAIAVLLLVIIHSSALEAASELLVRRLKVMGFAAVIRQEIGWFDSPDNHPGSLTSAVATNPQSVAAATGVIFAQILIGSANLSGSVVLGFILSTRFALVVHAPIVAILLAGGVNVYFLERYERDVSVPAGHAASYVAENMDAVREVAALGRELEIMRVFDERAKAAPSRNRYLIFGAGGFAFAQAMVLFVSALVFYWGGQLYADGTMSQSVLYSGFEAAVIGTFSAGRLLTFLPDIGRAAAAFKMVIGWSERKPKIASMIPADAPPTPEEKRFAGLGDIVFSDVELRYPQRPDHPALQHLDLTIKSGKTHAFVGPSGSGKSTILQQIARFYDPCQGTLKVGDVDVRKIPLEEYRECIALVSQEPVLISGSVRWNLSLGARDPSSVTQEQLEEACEQANILDFIRGLPQGFDTDCGTKGTQLSGGQKQRICIARALMRDPQILLLDEATSALDAESEVSVQRALDKASKGRTVVTIAHRLSTIRHADTIHVVEDGQIRESGTHSALLERKGRYLELVQAQL
ncbi:P-loop containing nucleoside triphosphate hydrolase protein [Ceraceosorus guamensis]|uniref:P-loop containing nucleoside triphosphate hydrolase protein n=1 Tax=Ceraceosorus guamensis TaxID=1522189 RepID=A0A316VZW4_9BASI|nr:P-loop containing nucleoside triphosphate hydrolase protein [Ceraceosorus guamensis]PWN43022.1 P-loop containing nucleoside triphosphate hydrolase protein [Ceraceosorus guamensis]